MSIQKGQAMPEGAFGVMTDSGPGRTTTGELFTGRKVVLFSVPGAFTPTCSNEHLPGYVNNAGALQDKGVDRIACMAVNDVFVMDAWGRSAGAGDAVMMLADGNGDYTRALGLELDASGFGMGMRGQRFSIVVDDGVVTELNVEPGGGLTCSSAKAALEQLEPQIPATQRQVLLRRYPEGVPETSDFELVEGPVEQPSDGEFLSRTLYLSLDPYLRGVISGRHLCAERVAPGSVMPGRTVAQVVESRRPDFSPGDIAVCSNGWQEYGLSAGAIDLRKLDPKTAPVSTAVGILGMPGLTAWAGLLHLGEPRPGETVVVSAACGPVGCMVGQLARIAGCRAVGIAGGAEKCGIVKNEFGFEDCVDYKTDNLGEKLKEACPDGIDIYFDNVGATFLTAAMGHLALGARVVLCGMMSSYNKTGPPQPGPSLIPLVMARGTVRGLVVYDHEDKQQDFLRACARWLKEGRIRYREDIAEGLEKAPDAFCRLMRGENVGKALVRFA